MNTLESKVQQLISAIRWDPATPLHVVSAFDAMAYSAIGDIQSQAQWLRAAVESLYVMCDWASGDGPFDEPDAVERSRKLVAQLGITGPLNPQDFT